MKKFDILETLKSYLWLIILGVFVSIIFIMYLQQEKSCRPDSVITSIMNALTAIGTVGAVIVALWLSRPIREKLKGEYNYFEDDDLLEGKVKLKIKNASKIDIDFDKLELFDEKVILLASSIKCLGFDYENKIDTFYSISENPVLPDPVRVHSCLSRKIKKAEIKKVYIYTKKGNHFELKYDKNLK